jgi:hypothetical protein
MLRMIQSSCARRSFHQSLDSLLAFLLTQSFQIDFTLNTEFYASASSLEGTNHIEQTPVQARRMLPVLTPAYTGYVSS